ncbi:hypothetical protein KIN20_012760 [Parelaphostrongylus tenuis]|uniref:SCP domain-containing protein n=1 Tax=Parelaphostrongylus tenuis TaxID=148309 RepID=A0AAD5N1D4_PARTN|nr:hypothetical protein KIN20_012760 [Parelaphostrongylus tenuis]
MIPFLQMANANTTKVGCAYSVCDHTPQCPTRPPYVVFVCQYGESSVKVNAPIYKQGTPCSSCSSSCAAQLEKVLTKLKEDKLDTLNVAAEEWPNTPYFLQRGLQRLEEGLCVFTTTSYKLQQELYDFSDRLQQNLDPADIIQEYQEMLGYPQILISQAFKYSTILEARSNCRIQKSN